MTTTTRVFLSSRVLQVVLGLNLGCLRLHKLEALFHRLDGLLHLVNNHQGKEETSLVMGHGATSIMVKHRNIPVPGWMIQSVALPPRCARPSIPPPAERPAVADRAA
jgi:hypothetical protein